MSISIWCPFISEVATVKTVINTISSLRQYSKNKKLEINLINAFGEWDSKRELLKNLDINIIDFNKIDKDKLLKKGGFFRSRFFYIIIFIKSFFKLHNYQILSYYREYPGFSEPRNQHLCLLGE